MKIYSHSTPFNADLYTPVGLYLGLRNRFRKTCLLESNDYNSRQESKSFIGFDPIVELVQDNKEVQILMNGNTQHQRVPEEFSYADFVQQILNQFQFEHEKNGFFGRVGFEYTQRDETHLSSSEITSDIPLLHLFVFRYIIIFDHFTSEGFLIENDFSPIEKPSGLDPFLNTTSASPLPFEKFGNERSEFTDDEFSDLVTKGIEHCKNGDVFQLVLSNAFEQSFFGDDFQVYRQLRMLNPSPYLFYFDFEAYHLFGSSPEAQLIVQNGQAEIHPIAGTVAKTGIEAMDNVQVDYLINDEKENAEHTMLVDLARNDLSRDCTNVWVKTYKEIQHFSHVIHMVSKVCGAVQDQDNFKILNHSFPAGTLSGTPKPKALELIHHYEKTSRDFYGGAIGMFSPSGDLNMAIVIRSILSKDSILRYRAGAGIVLDSDPERETLEVHHKLNALRKAIEKTHELFTEKSLSR